MPSYLVSAKEAFVPTELYTPPIESIGEILRIKQSRYDQGFNQVNSMYRNIMDSEILSQHGNAKRKQFMDQADQAIKQLSNADLSMPENVALGESVFKPFWEDQRLVKEIGVVKNTRKELSYAESLRSSTDEKVRDQYNQYSVMDQQNLLKEIAESDPSEIDQLGPRAYSKKVDIAKEMDERLKDLGITNAQVKEIPNGGGYKVVDQFGKESVLPLNDFFMNSLSSDARSYLQTMGRVTGRNSYEIALQHSNGDKVAARGMVANSIISEQRSSIEKNMIPEFTNAIGDAESRIRTIMLKRQSEGSQLTEQDAAEIDQYKQVVLGYKKKLSDYTDLSKQLGDKNSEKYKQYYETYQTSNGYNNAFTDTLISQHANGWAKSRANILSSTKVEADAAWKNKEDVITARMNIEAGMQKNDENNDVKLQIAQWNKEAKERKAGLTGTGTGSGVAGQSQKIYMGKSPTGLKPISKSTQYQAAYSELSNIAGVASIRLFDKTLNEQAQLGFTSKLYDEIEKGNGNKAFFKDKNNDDYKAFKKAIDAGILKQEPGRIYTWTHNEVFDLIAKNVNNYIKTEEGILKMGMTNADGSIDRDFQTMLRIGDSFTSLRGVQQEIHNKIYTQDKYKNFVTNDGGMDRLKTVDELAGDVTLDMRNASGQIQQVKVSDLIANKDRISTISDNGVYVQGSGTTGRTYRSTVNINGADLSFVSGDPRTMSLIKNGDTQELASMYNAPMVSKLNQLKSEFETDFEKLSPALNLNIPDNATMFQLGDLRFLSNDEKTIENAEQAAMTLLGPENRRNRMSKFIGVEPDDLKEDSPFMQVVDAVANNLQKYSVTKDGPTLDMIPYDIDAGQAAYKIRVNRKQIVDALGMSEADFNKNADFVAAAKKFESDGFRIVAPDNVPQPGDLITGFNPVDNIVKQKGFTTDASLDKMGVGGFSIKPEYKGGFTISSWNYRPDANGNMIKDVQNLGQIDEAVNTSEMIDVLYKGLFDAYKQTKQVRKANPTQPAGNISIEETRKTLKNLGINVN